MKKIFGLILVLAGATHALDNVGDRIRDSLAAHGLASLSHTTGTSDTLVKRHGADVTGAWRFRGSVQFDGLIYSSVAANKILGTDIDGSYIAASTVGSGSVVLASGTVGSGSSVVLASGVIGSGSTVALSASPTFSGIVTNAGRDTTLGRGAWHGSIKTDSNSISAAVITGDVTDSHVAGATVIGGDVDGRLVSRGTTGSGSSVVLANGITGVGTVAVMSNSPILTTPNIGSATGSISGNAGTATILATARTINGTSFNGSADITITAAAGTLTGSALAGTITSAPGVTSLGTLTGLNTSGAVAIGGALGSGDLLTVVDNVAGTVQTRVRNSSSSALAYAMMGLNASGNSYAFRMGSAAANGNLLELVVDAYGSPVTLMSVTTAGIFTFVDTAIFNVGIRTPRINNGGLPLAIGGKVTGADSSVWLGVRAARFQSTGGIDAAGLITMGGDSVATKIYARSVAAGGGVTSSGSSVNSITKWTGASSIGNSSLSDDGTEFLNEDAVWTGPNTGFDIRNYDGESQPGRVRILGGSDSTNGGVINVNGENIEGTVNGPGGVDIGGSSFTMWDRPNNVYVYTYSYGDQIWNWNTAIIETHLEGSGNAPLCLGPGGEHYRGTLVTVGLVTNVAVCGTPP